MTVLLDAAIRTSVILVAALAAVAVLRKRSAALRHLILSVAILLSLAVPVAQTLVPEWSIALGQSWTQAVGPSNASTLVPGSPAPAIDPGPSALWHDRAELARRLLLTAWLTGVIFALLRLFAGLCRLAWFAARAEHVRQHEWTDCADDLSFDYRLLRRVQLLQSEHPVLVVTWGIRRPKIMLPSGADTWSPDRIRVVLGHELAHILRYDWFSQMAAELLRSVHWFNPLAWAVCQRLRQESEQACDDLVLGSGIQGSNYATHLLDLARAAIDHRTARTPALAIARPSSLERRIRAMLIANVSRKPLSRRSGVIVALAGISFAVPVAGFTTSPTARPAGVGRSVTAPITIVRQSILDRRPSRELRARLDTAAGAVAGTTLAQAAFASFSGTMSDQLGGVLPGVTLTLVNTQTTAKQEVRSDRSGRFEFVGLPPGDYQFEARLPGFETLRRVATFGAGMVAQADLTLQIGSIVETVTVVSDAGAPATAGSVPVVRAGSVPVVRSSNAVGGRVCGAPVQGGVGGNIKPPAKIASVNPIYPASAQDAKIEGVVILQGRIDTSGFVTDLRILRSPHPDLASAAIEAVVAWRFDATLLNCVPVDTTIVTTVNFSIRK